MLPSTTWLCINWTFGWAHSFNIFKTNTAADNGRVFEVFQIERVGVSIKLASKLSSQDVISAVESEFVAKPGPSILDLPANE